MDLNFTAEEVERMRALVAQADNANKTTEFDLNNPPKKPYTHQEFPRCVYDHKKRASKVVANDKDLAAALKAGFKKEPFLAEGAVETVALDDDDRAAAAAEDAKAREPKK